MDGSVARSTFLAVTFSLAATVAVVVLVVAGVLVAGAPSGRLG